VRVSWLCRDCGFKSRTDMPPHSCPRCRSDRIILVGFDIG